MILAIIGLTAISSMPMSVSGAPLLHGIGVRDPLIQKSSRKSGYPTHLANGVTTASYAGGLTIFIKGQEFAPDAEKNYLLLENQDADLSFYETKFVMPDLSYDDSLNSNAVEGYLSYKLPPVHEIVGMTESGILAYPSLTFKVLLHSVVNGELRESECSLPANCFITYELSSTPYIRSANPQVLYEGASTQVHMNLKNVPNLMTYEDYEELPIIETRINNDFLDFSQFMDAQRLAGPMMADTIIPVDAHVQSHKFTSNGGISAKFDSGHAKVNEFDTQTCRDISTAASCYNFMVLPIMTGASQTEGVVSGGQVLEIMGKGFSEGDPTVMVGGESCYVTASTDTKITCVTSSASSPDSGSLFANQKGLVMEIYRD